MIRIEQCGWLTTIQDEPRNGWQSYGVSMGGAMDTYAWFTANALVLNEMHTAVLEITQSPHRFYTDENMVVAFAGGGLQPICNGKQLALYMPHFIPAGSELVLTDPLPGFRLYMSVMGGFEANKMFGSCATDISLSAGGYNGKLLRKGNLLRVHTYRSEEQKRMLSMLSKNASITPLNFSHPYKGNEINVYPGAEYYCLSDAAKQQISKASFTIGMSSNRMGYLLENNAIEAINKNEIISSPVTQGTIQRLPSGAAMLLMADAQTMGGYPRILQTAMADLPKLAQKKPGESIHFCLITQKNACTLLQKRIKEQKQLKARILQWFK